LLSSQLKSSQESSESSDDEDAVWENATENEIVARLQHLLQKKKYAKACSLLASAKQTFPEHVIFGADLDELSALKVAYLAHTDASAEEGQAEGDQSQPEASATQAEATELEKQRVVVAYLRDSVGFAEGLNCALPTICMLLGSKQVKF
jgi:hypothetical protein